MIHQENLPAALDAVCQKASAHSTSGRPFVIGIDGPCGSGKSTLAEALHERLGGLLVRMDSYFLQPHQRSESRLSQPGGNFDLERFEKQIAKPLRCGSPLILQQFSCKTQTLSNAQTMRPEGFVIIEGTFSFHPALQDLYDLRIGVTIDPETQRERLSQRESPDSFARFQTRWIPLENLYFQTFSPLKNADFLF